MRLAILSTIRWLGAVIRDYQGQVLGSLRIIKDSFSSVLTAETLGHFETVNFCKDMGFTSLILEGDALKVIQILRKEVEDWSEGGCIIHDARALLGTFANWSA